MVKRIFEKAFYSIRKQYFFRWDKGNEWDIVSRNRGVAQGYCDDVNMRIEIQHYSDDEDLEFLLIHEICHAVTRGYHGKAWQRRMLKSAERAEKLDNQHLASRIRDEVRYYQETHQVKASDVYQRMEDILLENPDVTYGQVVQYLVGEYACIDEKEFAKKYKQARMRFDKAKKDWRNNKNIR